MNWIAERRTDMMTQTMDTTIAGREQEVQAELDRIIRDKKLNDGWDNDKIGMNMYSLQKLAETRVNHRAKVVARPTPEPHKQTPKADPQPAPATPTAPPNPWMVRVTEERGILNLEPDGPTAKRFKAEHRGFPAEDGFIHLRLGFMVALCALMKGFINRMSTPTPATNGIFHERWMKERDGVLAILRAYIVSGAFKGIHDSHLDVPGEAFEYVKKLQEQSPFLQWFFTNPSKAFKNYLDEKERQEAERRAQAEEDMRAKLAQEQREQRHALELEKADRRAAGSEKYESFLSDVVSMLGRSGYMGYSCAWRKARKTLGPKYYHQKGLRDPAEVLFQAAVDRQIAHLRENPPKDGEPTTVNEYARQYMKASGKTEDALNQAVARARAEAKEKGKPVSMADITARKTKKERNKKGSKNNNKR